jgi:uncharacterized protein (DUF305 family)
MATALPEAPLRPSLTGFRIVLAIVILAAIALAALVSVRAVPPRDDSADAGFARDMATHHAQAVDMALVVRDETPDAELRALAYDIINTQATQRGIFMGWLQAWGLPQASRRPRMAWMPGHATLAADAGPVLMHGMATEDELKRLRAATGRDAEILFLQLMIRHHEGGIVMARAVIPISKRPEVAQMARSIEDGQRVEIETMTGMLARRGARPLP